LLATAVAAANGNILVNVPMTASLSHWTATTSNLAIVTVLGIACFGFYASRAGQPLFGKLDVGRILRPRALRISAAKLLADVRIRALPEAPEILCHLYRPAVRRE